VRKTITYAYLAGIPLRVHWNWFPIALVVALSFSVGYFPLRSPDWSRNVYWIVGFTTTSLFFASVLIHELAHALMATREGVKVNNITLFIFGGAAHLDNEPPSAGADFRIVIAGPLSSISLGFLFFLSANASAGIPTLHEVCRYLSYMNFMLAGFNLIPGFPLDGGRILRAILWKITGSMQKATRMAALGGYLVAALFIFAGITFIAQENLYNGSWSSSLGLFLAYITYDSNRRSKKIALQQAK
jgi:Zn-dependent protease